MADDIKITDQFVLFWGGWPSQWFKCSFTIDDVTYNCCEQYMMAEKARVFRDHETLSQILESNNPRDQKALGRKTTSFDENQWNRVCREIVYSANLAKFAQNADLKELLLATDERTIVEASPKDRIWGIGLHQDDERSLQPNEWLGTNWLGIALMQVRHAIRYPGQPVEPELKRQLDERSMQQKGE